MQYQSLFGKLWVLKAMKSQRRQASITMQLPLLSNTITNSIRQMLKAITNQSDRMRMLGHINVVISWCTYIATDIVIVPMQQGANVQRNWQDQRSQSQSLLNQRS